MSITFNREDKLSFEMRFRTSWGSGYDEKAGYFKKYGVDLPDAEKACTFSGDDHDSYKIYVEGPINVFKACVVTIDNFYYDNDENFCA